MIEFAKISSERLKTKAQKIRFGFEKKTRIGWHETELNRDGLSTRALVKGFVKLFPGSTHMLLRPLIQLCFKPKIPKCPKISLQNVQWNPWLFHGFSLAFPWIFQGFPCVFHGFSMCFPSSHGIFQWFSQRFSVPLRLRRGARPELATASCGFSAGEPVGEGLATSGEWFWAYPVGFWWFLLDGIWPTKMGCISWFSWGYQWDLNFLGQFWRFRVYERDMNRIWTELNDVIDGILPFFGVMKHGGALRN